MAYEIDSATYQERARAKAINLAWEVIATPDL